MRSTEIGGKNGYHMGLFYYKNSVSMPEVGVAGGNLQCHVGPEYDLCGLFSVLRQLRALRWQSVGLSRRSAFVCYSVRYSVECEYRQLWSI